MTPIIEREDYKALYATVLEHPEADVPRLVLADYLQEQGEETYAEFIRVQIELALAARDGHGRNGSHQSERDSVDGARNWPQCSGCVALEPLERREGELWGKIVGTWDWGCLYREWDTNGFVVQPSFHNFRREDRAFRLHRGFIDEVKCPLDWWIGRECPRCHGEGSVVVYSGHKDIYGACRNCHGSGLDRASAHGPRVVLEHPVTIVKVTDGGGGGQWVHWQYPATVSFGVTGVEQHRSWFVQSEMWPYGVESSLEEEFDSREDALDAISRNLLAWARKESVK